MKETADKVYRNAKVYSVALDGTETHAEALAIKDGKFAYVGDETGATEWIGDATEVIDCKGKSVIPGLGDAHLHNAQATLKYGTCSFSDIIPNPETDTPDGAQSPIPKYPIPKISIIIKIKHLYYLNLVLLNI